MQSQIYKCSKEKDQSVLLDDKLARNQCCVCYREVKTYQGLTVGIKTTGSNSSLLLHTRQLKFLGTVKNVEKLERDGTNFIKKRIRNNGCHVSWCCRCATEKQRRYGKYSVYMQLLVKEC